MITAETIKQSIAFLKKKIDSLQSCVLSFETTLAVMRDGEGCDSAKIMNGAVTLFTPPNSNHESLNGVAQRLEEQKAERPERGFACSEVGIRIGRGLPTPFTAKDIAAAFNCDVTRGHNIFAHWVKKGWAKRGERNGSYVRTEDFGQ